MKVFERSGKMNFVDDNNMFVGFDYSDCCCEAFGWSLSRRLPEKDDDLVEGAGDIDPDGFQFDPSYFVGDTPPGVSMDDGGVAIFRLTREDDEIFLTLWNSHNGYYAHGFEVAMGGEIVRSGSL